MLIPVCVLLSVLNGCLALDLTYYVKEGQSPGTLVGDITADTHLMDIVPLQDQRMITFSQLKQHEASMSQLFRVSKNTGKLFTTQMLDAEAMCKPKKECDKMMDIAVRKGTSFIKLLEIKVIIRDVNDHQPEFPDKQASIQFSEGDGIGMRKSIPNAMDRDVGVLNSQITYQLKKNKDEPFTLSISERVDGTSDLSISLEERLDREVKDSYMIQVIAKDEGSPPKQDVLDVYISVIDVNDNAPVFSQKVYNVSVNNEYDRTTPVVILSASDLDSEKNGKISYRFSSKTSAVARNFFELIEETGEIFLWKKFALEQGLTYELYIEATDGGNPPLSALAMVLVNVINQQNNPPSIDLNFVFSSSGNTTTISEDIEVGSFIAYVKVTDHDVGQNGEIICDLHHDKFQLQNLGTKKYKVIIKKSLDTESEDHHEITISCQDKGSPSLHSESKFSVQVMDVNDVQPQFFKETYKFRIYENQKSKIPVGFINATDPDQGPGGKLTYSLLTNNKKFLPFQITNDGLISTISSLDHEFQDMYKFQVMVKDNGIPSLNNSVNVIVEVRDENDNAPYFTFPSVNPFVKDILYFPHHTKNITVLRASDSDSRENAFLKYEITAGNEKQLFTLNHYTGLLFFTREVTHHDTGSYELEFVVKDSGTPVLSATITLSLTLTVSNKSSEVLNAVHIQTGDKIHLNLVIIVTLIAVTLSVVITASMSICILRYSNRINAPEGDVVNPPQRHLMCPSYHANSWPDVPGAITMDPTLSKNVNLTAPRRESHPGDEFGNPQKGSPSALKPRTTADITCQERAMLAAGEKHEHSPIMTLGYNTWRSTKSSHTDSRRGWSEGETGHGEKVPDLFLPQYCVLPPSQTDQLHINDLKSLQETFNFPSEATAGARILYKPSTGQQTQWTAPKSATLGCGNTDFQPQLKTLSTSSHRISYPRPLPPVPK